MSCHFSCYNVRAAGEPRLRHNCGPERHAPDAVRQAGAVEELDDLDVQVLAPDDNGEAGQDDAHRRHRAGVADRRAARHAAQVLQRAQAGKGAHQPLLPRRADAGE